ncbi:MAG: TonB-dependent receptor [Brevundimonas sp.]|uniref:TonB-dependent receptor n=2 Tax=Brevundimonas TaxID=41275 RepID=A0ABY4SSK9_9CAUL|nr:MULTISPECIES: TonB-dependent receptor [Brevundimonas]PZU61622.1 MAG: TonB-dependent receptor [Brevundimonas sp.]UQV19037.1 TonB-dependent receptor [Brevundimonas albigilva]URI16074.1 TonB-dependent receptor [Brevundimonas albigilva]
MKRAFLLVAASSVALAAAAPALAQTSGQTSGQASAQPAQVDDIVVTGAIVSGERRALNIQKNADNILNVVSSDGIGRLPDRNAAEAVQRAPGVAIERDQGEGRFVAVRGLPSQWNSTLINGDRLPTAEEETTSRATAFDFFPSELIDRVEISKAVTPDMEGDAIGGSVNFITRTAPAERTVQATGGLTYSDKAGEYGDLLSLTVGDRLMDGKFGFLLSGTRYVRDWATDNYEPRRGGDGIGVTRLELRDYTGTRETVGLNGAAEYNFDNGGQVFGRAIYGTLEDDETHYKHRLNFASNRVEVQHIFNTLITEMSGGEIGGRHPLAGGDLNWKIGSYQNEFRYGDTPDGQDHSYFVVRFDQRGVGYQGLENRGAGTLAYNTIDGGTDPADAISNHLPAGFQMNPALTRLANVELYKVAVTERDRVVAQVDYTREIGSSLELKFGAKYRDKQRDAAFEDLFYTWNPAAGPVPTLADFALMDQPGRGDFLDELDIGAQYRNQFSQVVSEDDITAWYRANRQNLILDAAGSATLENGGALGRTFTLNEKQSAAYAMATWRPDPRWTVLGGLRLEHTDTAVDGQVLIDGDLSPEHRSNDYLAVLPSLHLTYSLDADTNLRAAVTRTFARPDFGDLAPGGAFIEADLEFAGGNPDLKPTYSTNLDLMFERFYSDVGVISAGAFYKRIEDPIFDSRTIGSFRGVDGVAFLTPANGEPGWLYGLELNLQRRLTFLPGALSHVGVNANYTYIQSEFELPDGRHAAIPRQADNLGNVAVYYDDGRLSGRLALNYKGAFIEEYGSDAASDSYYGEYTSLDFNLAYDLTDRVTLFGEASNLTDEKLFYYLGDEDRPLQVEYYGPRFLAGVKARF